MCVSLKALWGTVLLALTPGRVTNILFYSSVPDVIMAVSLSLGIKVELVDPDTQNIFFIQKGVPERLGNVWYTPCLSTHVLLQLQLQLTLALISQAQSLLKSITPIFQVFNNSFIPGSFLEYLLYFLCFFTEFRKSLQGFQ